MLPHGLAVAGITARKADFKETGCHAKQKKLSGYLFFKVARAQELLYNR
jgi:hypothetical protein